MSFFSVLDSRSLSARTALWIGTCFLWVSASRALAEEPVAVLDALFGDARRTLALEALLQSAPLGEEEAVRVVEIGRDAHSSHHLVWLRAREEPHRHLEHDLLVVIVRGSGQMRLGEEERPVGQGSILYVPRGAVHAFRNTSDGPAAAYAIYTPPFDGQDRVPVSDSP